MTWRFGSRLGSKREADTIQALGQYQSQFKQLVAYLIFSSTDDSHHYVLLHRDQQLLFPQIPSDEVYWLGLSTLPVFEGKAPSELRYQTIALLYVLLCVSGGFSLPRSLEPSRDFLPLQNLCLYFEAFRVEERPLRALRPLDEKSLAEALQQTRLFSHDITIQPRMMESWDNYMRKVLPIDCPRYEVVGRPGF